MAIRTPLVTIAVRRDGKRVYLPKGVPAEFTDAEIAHLAATCLKPLPRTAPAPEPEDDEEAEAAARVAAAKGQGGKGKRKAADATGL